MYKLTRLTLKVIPLFLDHSAKKNNKLHYEQKAIVMVFYIVKVVNLL